MTYRLYWGDLHSHCSVSYGSGTPEQALMRARDQLDFCSITGHAFWPDMPTDRERYARVIDTHLEGFARLAVNWDALLRTQREWSVPGRFLALPSYEWHSMAYGDHNVYGPSAELPLRNAPDLPSLRRAVAGSDGVAIPHHIGYAAGYRGVDWAHFDAERSPFVEIFSLHGCSVSEHAPYPMLHTMGPRDFGSTAEAGWAMGHRFGIVGGTDHHGAYPGSHGEGRMGVFARELTVEALWEAFRARRVFAATGDRIDAGLVVDDAWIGEAVKAPKRRHLRAVVRGADTLDQVRLVKNGRVAHRFFPTPPADTELSGRYRLRLTWGWGRGDETARWQGQVSLSDGAVHAVETCFAGAAVVTPRSQRGSATPEPEDEDRPHALLETSERSCAWRSVTTGNPSPRQDATQSLSLEVEAPLTATLRLEVNGRRYEHRLGELLHAGRSHYMRGWLSEAIRVGPLTPVEDCTVEAELTDPPERAVDVYRLEVAQTNGQWAWLTPIWAER